MAGKDRFFQMRVSEEFLGTIDEWRRHQPDIPPRAEAIRRLTISGLLNMGAIQTEYLQLLHELKEAGRLTDAEWQRVQQAVTAHADKLSKDLPSLRESYEKAMGLK